MRRGLEADQPALGGNRLEDRLRLDLPAPDAAGLVDPSQHGALGDTGGGLPGDRPRRGYTTFLMLFDVIQGSEVPVLSTQFCGIIRAKLQAGFLFRHICLSGPAFHHFWGRRFL